MFIRVKRCDTDAGFGEMTARVQSHSGHRQDLSQLSQ